MGVRTAKRTQVIDGWITWAGKVSGLNQHVFMSHDSGSREFGQGCTGGLSCSPWRPLGLVTGCMSLVAGLGEKGQEGSVHRSGTQEFLRVASPRGQHGGLRVVGFLTRQLAFEGIKAELPGAFGAGCGGGRLVKASRMLMPDAGGGGHVSPQVGAAACSTWGVCLWSQRPLTAIPSLLSASLSPRPWV